MGSLHISLAAETVADLGWLAVTNSMIASVLGSTLLAFLFVLATRRMTLQPRAGVSGMIEAGSEVLLDVIERVTYNRARAVQYFPFLMTLFVFILVNNWLGLVPGVGTVTVLTDHGRVPLLRGATADLNMTFALAIVSVGLTQLYAIRRLGLFVHLRKYLHLNPVLLFVGLLELVSEFSRMVSFSFRLFGNIFAGEVLLLVMGYLVPLVAPLPFFALELFVGFVQAFVFTMLTLVFLEIATAEHSGHDIPTRTSAAGAVHPVLS